MDKTLPLHLPFLGYMAQGEIKRVIHRIFSEMEKKKAKALAVLSPNPREGRTFFSGVLALGAAIYMKKRVLIVDTNRQPGKEGFQLERVLSNAPNGASIDLIKTEPSPGQFQVAADFEFEQILQRYQGEYDLIVLDTAAISTSSDRSTPSAHSVHSVNDSIDPLIVAKAAGYAIIVLSNASISSGNNGAIAAELKNWDISVLGTLFNFGPLK